MTSLREELVDEIVRVPEELAEWAPVEGMRTYRGQLLEIGVTERHVHGLIATGTKPEWQPLFDSLSAKGGSLVSLMAAMNDDRVETLASLERFGESGLQEQVAVPEGWSEWIGADAVERADLYRWIVQHEYYHLGQIVTYNWFRGDDPYKR